MTNATTNNRPFAALHRRCFLGALVGSVALFGCRSGQSSLTPATSTTSEATAMQLTQEWDKTFPKSDQVDHQKVTFKNRYGITLAADLYLPKNRGGERLAALAVGGPFGAVNAVAESHGAVSEAHQIGLRSKVELLRGDRATCFGL